MAQIDCDKYLDGINELERKRNVISQIAGVLQKFLDGEWTKTIRNWKHNETVLEIPMESKLIFKVCRSYKGHGFSMRVSCGEETDFFTHYGNSLPVWAVPIVHDHISEIVERIGTFFPQAKIIEHFQFYMKQTKN